MIKRQDTLKCPKCFSDYLHQVTVEIYMRGEDDSTGLYIQADRTQDMKLDRGELPQGNPSPRRQGFRLFFQCELCLSESRMIIAQHKGQTFMEWEDERDGPVVVDEGTV